MSIFGFRLEIDRDTGRTTIMFPTGRLVEAEMDLVHLHTRGASRPDQPVRYKRDRMTGELTVTSRQDPSAVARLEKDLKKLQDVATLMLALTAAVRQLENSVEYAPW